MHNPRTTLFAIPRALPRPNTAAEPFAAEGAIKLGYVVAFDFVGFSQLSLDNQSRYVLDLTRVVSGVDAYTQAEERGELIPVATGDGMALVFFGNPLQPVCCALQVAALLCQYPHLKLRMGIHCGPVSLFRDIHEKE